MALQRPSLPASLLKQAQQHQHMQQAIRASLGVDLGAHVTFINLRGGTLILGCNQQSMVTTLRFCAPRILDAVNALLPTASALRVAWRTQSAFATPRSPRTNALRPSADTIQTVTTSADCIHDPELRNAMQNLAQAMRAKASSPA